MAGRGVFPPTLQGIPVQPPDAGIRRATQQNGLRESLIQDDLPQAETNAALEAFTNYAIANPGAIKNLHGDTKISFHPASSYNISSHFGPNALKYEAVGLRRGTLNWIPFIIGITFPWVVFSLSLAMNAFHLREVIPFLCDVLNWIGILTCIIGLYPFLKDRTPYDVRFVIALMCLFYLCLGWVLGSLVYWFRMNPYYQLSGMANYHGVNPSRFKHLTMTQKTDSSAMNQGEQYQFKLEDSGRKSESKRYQDAAVVYFDSPTISIDVDKTMSFKDGDTYCVAPIVDTACSGVCGYDFWAVGVNCCGTDGELAFTCDIQGDVPASPIRSGVRWVEPLSRTFFRLAVNEAEGAHNIAAPHPLFFSFYSRGENPVLVVAELARSAYRKVFTYSFVSFWANTFFMVYVSRKLVFSPKAMRRNKAKRDWLTKREGNRQNLMQNFPAGG